MICMTSGNRQLEEMQSSFKYALNLGKGWHTICHKNKNYGKIKSLKRMHYVNIKPAFRGPLLGPWFTEFAINTKGYIAYGRLYS